ncbi:MAG: hypothetical protein DSM107014_00215 [Gomphosphaeria aponina SAG 52.96 = DSM 107014]|uniref:Uncharacterized protein n=1 Tax=Gomphosphaeria aponina SAG 52.96 = DSM 107014 TaxID=1521640 RepID=A0A941GM50_9CHRO|nr:hypothetical protein [Gomphosphaeria aponina SAG 52.96 = DSM 107014]
MTERQELIQIFSTFPDKGVLGNFPVWVEDSQLKKSIEYYLNQLPSLPTPEECASQIFVQWQQTPESLVLQKHLTAYLGRVCYDAVQSFANKYHSYGVSQEDYFQDCQTRIGNILNKFKPEIGFLKSYAYTKFVGFFKDYVRKKCDPKAFRTDLWLLNCKTMRSTKKALEEYGLYPEEIPKYILVREYFNKLAAPTHKNGYGSLQGEADPVWERIARAYNQEKPGDFPRYNEQDIFKIIQTIIDAIVYRYFNNKVTAPEAERKERELINEEFSEELEELYGVIVEVFREIKGYN